MRSRVRGKVEAEAVVLLLVPRGADAEDGAAVRDHVERRDDLGEQRGVAVRDAGDERAELHAFGARGERAEQRVRLEDRLVGPAERGQLPEVVHHPHRLEPARLGRDRVRAHVVEHRRRSNRRRARKLGICNPKVVMARTLRPARRCGDCVADPAQRRRAHRLDLDDAAVVNTKVDAGQQAVRGTTLDVVRAPRTAGSC